MTLDIQFRIKNNEIYLKHLRENSHWYKILNRNPEMFEKFEDEVKETYKLKPIHRINKTLETVTMVQTVLSTLKS